MLRKSTESDKVLLKGVRHMPLSRAELGKRLRIARMARGWSQGEVATALTMSRPIISQIENGQVGLSAEDLARFAQLYGKPVEELLAPERPNEAFLLRFRALNITEDAEARLTRAFEQCRHYAELENILAVERRMPPQYPVEAPQTTWDGIRMGESYARDFRTHLRHPLPDLRETLEEAGIRVIALALGEVQGASAVVPNVGACVFVNSRDPLAVQNFTLAHELAHVLFDWRRGVTADTDFFAQRQDPVETRANVFAANLLMPEEAVRDWLLRRGVEHPNRHQFTAFEIAGLAESFGASHQVVLYRLKNLGYIDEETRDRLAQVTWPFLPRWMREPRSEDEERFGRMVQLAITAYQRQLISQDALAEYLDMDPVEAKRFVDSMMTSTAAQ
jgi:Zn-dependent peptidase ImmA (M78 family)/DNA-binding XRE family transcriptional regulator